MFSGKPTGCRWVLILATVVLTCLSFQEAFAGCHIMDVSRTAIIKEMGGRQTRQLLKVYHTEGFHCYIGNHGSSFGPFQLHYGGRHNTRGNRDAGMGEVFTRQTGLNARNPSTVPAQIRFMKRWGASHGGFSSTIWHGLRGGRGRHVHHWHHWHHWHHRHRWTHRA